MRYLTPLCTMLLFAALLASCSSSETSVSEVIPEYGERIVSEYKMIEETKIFPEHIDLIGDKVAVFTVVISPDAPKAVVESVHHNLLSKIDKTDLYTMILSDEELTNRLNQNPKLAQAKDIYLDSLTAVSVSDKDISNPLGKTLAVDNFLVLQLDRWPCPDCTQKKSLRIKLRLVDSETSYVIWTGIAEMSKLSPVELENIDTLALKLADRLTEEFNWCFMKKWHRKRYDNLAKQAG